MIKPIETEYCGYRFRSRLEARWAVFFDVLGLEYIYEIEGFILDDKQWYLPDFWFPQLKCYGEVKATIFTKQEFKRCQQLGICILLDGMPAVEKGYYVVGASTDFYEDCYHSYVNNRDYGRILLDHSCKKKRLWFLCGESLNDYQFDLTPNITARQARFEYIDDHTVKL